MKIIENDKSVTVIMEDNDVLEISTLRRNKEKVVVKCLDSVIHIDELTVNQIKEKSLEEENIKLMKDYLDKNRE